MNDIIKELNVQINSNKIATIRNKLNFLFGYSSENETVSEFNKFKAELISEVKKYQEINNLYLNIIHNSSNSQELSDNKDRLFVLITNFRELIKNFEETGTIAYLNDAVDLYINEVQQTAQNIRNLKYTYNQVELSNDNTYHLIQKQYTLAQFQIPINNVHNKIIVYKK